MVTGSTYSLIIKIVKFQFENLDTNQCDYNKKHKNVKLFKDYEENECYFIFSTNLNNLNKGFVYISSQNSDSEHPMYIRYDFIKANKVFAIIK